MLKNECNVFIKYEYQINMRVRIDLWTLFGYILVCVCVCALSIQFGLLHWFRPTCWSAVNTCFVWLCAYVFA